MSISQKLFGCLFLIAALALSASCSKKAEPPAPVASANSMKALVDSIGDHTQKVLIGAADGPQMLIVPELSARVIGVSFDGDKGENLMWVNSSILDGTYWSKKPYYWNVGGYRTWIAPEDLFFLDDKKTWFVPASLDPAPFSIVEQTASGATLEADMNLKTNTGKYYKLTMTRKLSLLTEIPSELDSIPSGVKYVGIGLQHSLTNRSEEVIGTDLPYICLWNMLQANPSGTMLIPVVEGSDTTAYREYFNPLGDRIKLAENIISVKIDGQYRCKIGVRPDAAKSGIAFLKDNKDGSGILYLLQFPVDPKGIYVDKPWGKKSNYGDAIEMYNDDGKMGGFTEVECHGPAKKLKIGETQSHTINLHIFSGKIEDLKNIGSKIYSTDLSKAVYF